MFELYRPGDSFLHRMRPGAKLLALAGGGTAIFLLPGLPALGAVMLAVLMIYGATGLGLSAAWAQLRPVLVIFAILFAAQVFISGWLTGAFFITRFATLLMLAGLLTLTTRVSDMVAALEHGLEWLRPLGLNPSKISLALALALRFIPVLAQITSEVREAQRVRGLDRSIIAIAIPVIVRTLRMSDAIADAIEARGYNPDRP